MATLRWHVLINRDPDLVWEVVSDPTGVSGWFPAITSSTGDERRRTIVLDSGARLQENVVTSNPRLRRFQYTVVGGDIAVKHHLGTIDVIEVDQARSLVVYSTEIEPNELAETFEKAIAEAVDNLPAHLG